MVALTTVLRAAKHDNVTWRAGHSIRSSGLYQLDVQSHAMRGTAIHPAHRLRAAVVAIDGPPNLARQAGGGRDDAAREQVVRNVAEQQLCLIEPGTVGRGEVDVDGLMRLENRRHLPGLVGRQIVRDDVDCAAD